MLLLGRKLAHVSFCPNRRPPGVCEPQFAGHSLSIDSLLQAEINGPILASVQQVVTFILRVIHSELLANVFCTRMDLQGKVSAAHRVEEIRTDRKFRAESAVNILSV